MASLDESEATGTPSPRPDTSEVAGKGVWPVGSRVLLKDPSSWIQPYRRLAMERRPATVVSDIIVNGGVQRIDFDVLRRGAPPVSMWAHPNELEPASNEPGRSEAGVVGVVGVQRVSLAEYGTFVAAVERTKIGRE